jgi:hypothetical protein
MRTGERPAEVFDALVERGQIVVHPTEVEALAALTRAEGLVVADTREQVAKLNAAIRDHHHTSGEAGLTTGLTAGLTTGITTGAGEQIGVGDRVATRRNDRDLDVANRDTWTVTGAHHDGSVTITGRNGDRTLTAGYVREHVELAYATTIHGAQGETVDHTHLLVGESTGAAAAYVGMTRGRTCNTAHLVADTLEDARTQWVEVFGRDRADLGPAHASQTGGEDIDRYGPQAPPHSHAGVMQRAALQEAARHRREPERPRPPATTSRPPSPGISI